MLEQMRKPPWIGLVAAATGVLGAAAALWQLLPLPTGADVYEARRWGVGTVYVGSILGFPLVVLAAPIATALAPGRTHDDASGAVAVAATVVTIVALNWAGWGALFALLVNTRRRRRAPLAAHASRPPA